MGSGKGPLASGSGSGSGPRPSGSGSGSGSGPRPSGSASGSGSGPRPSGSGKGKGPRGGRPTGKDGRPQGKIPKEFEEDKEKLQANLITKGGDWKKIRRK